MAVSTFSFLLLSCLHIPRCVLFLAWAPLRLLGATLGEGALAKVPGLSSGSPGTRGALNAKFYLTVLTSLGGS